MRPPLAALTISALLTTLLVMGCADDRAPLAPESTTEDLSADARVNQALAEANRLEKFALEPDGGAAKLIEETMPAERSALVVVPAGSANALAGALASAGTGGIVLLKSGMHTESGTVTITNRVNLIGESGAILRVDTDPYPSATFNEPALHVLGASRVFIWGVDLRPTQASGNTGILLENANLTTIGHSEVTDHQISVLLHQSDRVFLYGNTIMGSPDSYYGVEIVNGERATLVGNDISHAGAFGVFACDRDGTALLNHFHDCYIGLIFCKVPFGDAVLPGGEVIGAETPATDWIARWNNGTNNEWGYLAIDGATGCRMVHNAASNNGTYDVELAGDSERNGFFTPTCSNCTVISADPAIVVKDCGLNDTVIGGTLVDTDLDPCF